MARNKYNARRVFYNDYWFDSAAEMRRYQELVILQMADEISGLLVHPEYVLIAPFRDPFSGNWERAATYTPDFSYYEDNRVLVVEDIKSEKTAKLADYVLRRKLFKKTYPEIEFREVIS